VAERYQIGPIFTPPVVSKVEGPLATLTSGFATNWPGGSYDPETHIAYIYSQSGASPLGLVPSPSDLSDMDFIQGSALTGARRTGGSGSAAGGGRTGETAAPAAAGEGGTALTVQGLPLLKPPYARISAIDLIGSRGMRSESNFARARYLGVWWRCRSMGFPSASRWMAP